MTELHSRALSFNPNISPTCILVRHFHSPAVMSHTDSNNWT